MLLNGLVWISLSIALIAASLDHDIARTIAKTTQLDHITAFFSFDWFTTATKQPNGMSWWRQIVYSVMTGFGVFALLGYLVSRDARDCLEFEDFLLQEKTSARIQ